MEIKNAFYLTGFTRIDKGEQGAVFVRYDEPSERKGEPSINEAYLNYGGKFYPFHACPQRDFGGNRYENKQEPLFRNRIRRTVNQFVLCG